MRLTMPTGNGSFVPDTLWSLPWRHPERLPPSPFMSCQRPHANHGKHDGQHQEQRANPHPWCGLLPHPGRRTSPSLEYENQQAAGKRQDPAGPLVVLQFRLVEMLCLPAEVLDLEPGRVALGTRMFCIPLGARMVCRFCFHPVCPARRFNLREAPPPRARPLETRANTFPW